MARNAGHFPHLLTIDLRDETGWLGREDSNLRMAESKSDRFTNNINAHSEKIAKFDPLSTNRLATDSECDHADQGRFQEISCAPGISVTAEGNGLSEIDLIDNWLVALAWFKQTSLYNAYTNRFV
jgi:hypothetical protein